MAHPPRRGEVRGHDAFAKALPRLREQVEADLAATDELTRERVLACAVRLLDRGFFRVGTEEYTESFGLATIRKRHVRIEDGQMVFDYVAKSGKRRIQGVVDPLAQDIVCSLKKRRGGGPELLAYKQRPRSGTTCAPTTSTTTSRRRPAATSPPRTSAPGARP